MRLEQLSATGLPAPRGFARAPMDCLHVPLQPPGDLHPLARLCSAFAGQRAHLSVCVCLCVCVVQGLETPNPEAEY